MTNNDEQSIYGIDFLGRPASACDLGDLHAQPVKVPTIFIVGSPRSGTTALGKVMGANSMCVAAEESLFLISLWLDFDDRVLGNNRQSKLFLGTYTSPQNALKYMSEYVSHFYEDLLSSKKGAKYVIDHTPWYAYLFEFIELLFPDAIYVHIVRDSDDVAASLEKKVKARGGEWGQDNIRARKALRNLMVKEARDIKDKVPDRYFEINHEDFSNDPELAVQEVLGTISAKWEPAMADTAKLRRWPQVQPWYKAESDR